MIRSLTTDRAATLVRAIGLTLVLCASAVPAGEVLDEYRVKAVFLLNFAKLVEWPPNRIPLAGGPLVIGVHAQDEIAATIEEALLGTEASGHPIEVRRVEGPSQDLHMLFVDAEHGHAPDIVAAARRGSTLTVGETPDFAVRGGTVNFYAEENKVRFEINDYVAQQSGLKISSRLLRLARRVGGDE